MSTNNLPSLRTVSLEWDKKSFFLFENFRLKKDEPSERRQESQPQSRPDINKNNRNKRIQEFSDNSKKPSTIPDPEKPQGVLVSSALTSFLILQPAYNRYSSLP
jgi:hypothetical protein